MDQNANQTDDNQPVGDATQAPPAPVGDMPVTDPVAPVVPEPTTTETPAPEEPVTEVPGPAPVDTPEPTVPETPPAA